MKLNQARMVVAWDACGDCNTACRASARGCADAATPSLPSKSTLRASKITLCAFPNCSSCVQEHSSWAPRALFVRQEHSSCAKITLRAFKSTLRASKSVLFVRRLLLLLLLHADARPALADPGKPSQLACMQPQMYRRLAIRFCQGC